MINKCLYLSSRGKLLAEIMSKRTKSGKVNSKSSKKEIPVKEEQKEEEEVVSKYFVQEILKPKEEKDDKPAVEIKKRRSVEIKYENADQWFPKDWEKTLDGIREMRKGRTAPVDEMGCHKCSDENASPSDFRYQSLLALMLSSQTKDQVTHAAMGRLKQHGCSPDKILATSDEELGKLIYPVGFWKRKVNYIKKTTEILKEKYNGDIPNSIDGLCSLPGVGPKMAHICMKVAWDEVTGIGVDTHVHRISNRIGWVSKTTKTPEDTRKQLESWMPRNLWTEVNHLLVGFGQEICVPQNPKCDLCLNNSFCPSAHLAKKK